MATILVVDDSHSDRCLVGEYLKEDSTIEVSCAATGEEALQRMSESVPDLVLTDLRMPGMDGLELVAQIKNRYPFVPIVLMTSQGNEEIAVTALERGAASYVPKARLADDLLPTVHDLLEVSHWKRSRTRLMRELLQSGYEFELSNDRTLIPPLVGYLQECVAELGICDDSQKMRVGVALEEALANAYYHGNLEVDSELREQNGEAYEQLVAQRAATPPYRDRKIRVKATFSRDEAVFVLRDEGPGFDPENLPDPTDPANLEKASGRGVLLMRTFMDEVSFNERGNEVTMKKRRAAPAR